MSVMWWPWLALLFSFFGAGMIGFNQRYQMDARDLVIGRVVGMVPLAALAWWWLPWPKDQLFYIVAVGMGVVLGVSDSLLYAAAARYGGRLSALYIPLKSIMTFALWQAVVGVGWVSGGAGLTMGFDGWMVVVCLLTSGCALYKLRRNDGSWPALLAVLPVAVLLTMADVVAKRFLPLPGSAAQLWGAVLAYLSVSMLTGALGALVSGYWGGPRLRATTAGAPPRHWVPAAAFGAFMYVSVAVLLVTLVLAPNPGLVTVITMLSGVWLTAYGWLRGEPVRDQLGAIAVLLLSAMGVALLAP